MRRHSVTLFLFTIFFTMAVLTFFSTIGFAQEPDEAMPERQVTMAVEYPGIELQAGKDVTMDILFHNKGKSDETIDVRVASAPEGWTTVIKTYKYNHQHPCAVRRKQKYRL